MPGEGIEPSSVASKATVLPLNDPGEMVDSVGIEPTSVLVKSQLPQPIGMKSIGPR